MDSNKFPRLRHTQNPLVLKDKTKKTSSTEMGTLGCGLKDLFLYEQNF